VSEPQSSGALAVEMAGLDVIPESDRKGKPSDLFMPWFAANISVLGISWGSWVLGFGLSLAQAVVVSVVGVALSFVVCGLIAIAGKRIQISGAGRHQGLSFSRSHLRNTSLMKNDSTNQLYGEMFHTQLSLSRFSNGSKGFGQ